MDQVGKLNVGFWLAVCGVCRKITYSKSFFLEKSRPGTYFLGNFYYYVHSILLYQLPFTSSFIILLVFRSLFTHLLVVAKVCVSCLDFKAMMDVHTWQTPNASSLLDFLILHNETKFQFIAKWAFKL